MSKNFFFVLLIFSNMLYSQSVDFQDSYDYDLRRQRTETIGETEYFKEYTLPPKLPAQSLVTPKSIQKQADPSLLLPQASPFRARASTSSNTGTTPNANPLNPTITSNLPIDPLTGELNVNAILQNNNNRALKRQKVEREILEFQKQEYKETRFRRGEIIFFMTFPFAFGISALCAFAIETGQEGFLKSQQGSIFVITSTLGLSLGNVWLDQWRYDEFLDKKKKNPQHSWKDKQRFEENFQFTIPFFTFRF